MSIEYYLNQGYTPLTRVTILNGITTAAVWTPKARHTVRVTNAAISANNAGTIAFYWSGDDTRVAEFLFAGSANISPVIGVWEGTLIANSLVAKLGASATDGVRINLTGFEIPQS